MKSFVHTCLSIYDICDHNNLAYDIVMDALSNSDISFGTNFDTIITSEQLEHILERKLDYNNHDEDGSILVSLGS